MPINKYSQREGIKEVAGPQRSRLHAPRTADSMSPPTDLVSVTLPSPSSGAGGGGSLSTPLNLGRPCACFDQNNMMPCGKQVSDSLESYTQNYRTTQEFPSTLSTYCKKSKARTETYLYAGVHSSTMNSSQQVETPSMH